MVRYPIALIFLLYLCFPTKAQVSVVVPYPDSAISLYAENHLLDKEGNLYIVSTRSQFTGRHGHHGSQTYGSSVTKLDRGDDLLWHEDYSIFGQGMFSSGRPARQLFLSESNILVPFQKHYGYTSCEPNSVSLSASAAALLVDKATGTLKRERRFSRDTTCIFQSLQRCWPNKQGGFSCLYELQGGRGSDYDRYIENRSANMMEQEGDVIATHSGYEPEVFPDPYTKDQIVVSGSSIDVYDDKLQLLRSLSLPPFPLLNGTHVFSGAAGKQFYVISGLHWIDTTFYGFTAVIRKDGRLISIDTTEYFESIVVTDKNKIWGLTNKGGLRISKDDQIPVSVVQFTKELKPLRRDAFGQTFWYGNTLSIAGNEIIVTGTVRSDERQIQPAPVPKASRLFVYRKSVTDIPRVVTSPTLPSF
jgi:hypothetical protein